MTMFQRRFEHRAWAGLVAAGALVIVAGIAVRAEQGQGGGGRGGMVPMTASTIVRNPAAHMGETVSMMAAVEAQLSKTVFTVDQDKTKTGQEVLIIAPNLQTPPEANVYVTIQGEVFAFDPAEVAKKARRLSLMQLTERTCKWPVGDPATDDFWFCGLTTVPGKPYCETHVAVAFQPMSARRDRRAGGR